MNEEIHDLVGECGLLAEALRDAYEVVKTVEGDDSSEDYDLDSLRKRIRSALETHDYRRMRRARMAPRAA